jgi:hypothetical protein
VLAQAARGRVYRPHVRLVGIDDGIYPLRIDVDTQDARNHVLRSPVHPIVRLRVQETALDAVVK